MKLKRYSNKLAVSNEEYKTLKDVILAYCEAHNWGLAELCFQFFKRNRSEASYVYFLFENVVPLRGMRGIHRHSRLAALKRNVNLIQHHDLFDAFCYSLDLDPTSTHTFYDQEKPELAAVKAS